jgi:hypothetical protein
MSTKKTWLSIVIAAAIIAGVLCIAVVGGSVYWVSRHVNTQFTSTETATDELTRARARFAGQQPLIEIHGDGKPVIHRTQTVEGSGHTELRELHALVYAAAARKLVHANIPFWLLRLAPRNRLSLGDTGLDSDRLHLTLDDVEQRGPGLLVAGSGPNGEQILVWTD